MSMRHALDLISLKPANGLPTVTSPAAPAVLQPFASIKRWPRGHDIIYQDDVSEDWYCVVSGAARQCIVRPDGRRQIANLRHPAVACLHADLHARKRQDYVEHSLSICASSVICAFARSSTAAVKPPIRDLIFCSCSLVSCRCAVASAASTSLACDDLKRCRSAMVLSTSAGLLASLTSRAASSI